MVNIIRRAVAAIPNLMTKADYKFETANHSCLEFKFAKWHVATSVSTHPSLLITGHPPMITVH